jgi:hypothetical protein
MSSENSIRKQAVHMLLAVTLVAFHISVKASVPADSTKADYRYWPDERYVTESIRPYGNYLPFYSHEMEISAHEKTLYERLVSYYKQSRPLVKVLIYLALLFFLFLIINLSLIFTHRFRDLKREKTAAKIQTYYEDIISAVVFDLKPIPDPERLKKELENKFSANVFLEAIMDLHRNLSGESADALKALYINTGLDKLSLEKVKSKKWHIKAKGFRELSQMTISDGNDEIFQHLNSRNSVLRIEARLAWIRLHPENPFSFLDKPGVQITEWGKLNALAALLNNRIEVESFERWLSSPNPVVVIFALQMAGIFRHSHYASSVVAQIAHEDEKVRFAAYEAIRLMGLAEAATAMQLGFSSENTANRKKILQTLAEFRDINNTSFFADVIRAENSSEAILAVHALSALGSSGRSTLEMLIAEGRQDVRMFMEYLNENPV